MSVLWGDTVGWANVAVVAGRMQVTMGYVWRYPQDQAFLRALDTELARMERFLTARTSACSSPENAGTPTL